jgi:hypothetical protein
MRILFLAKALGPGEHWITVHPNGQDPGRPLLVQDQSDGSMKVIGGAGGSMNHMRFTPKDKGESTADAVKRRQDEAKAKKKEQTDQDKASGIHADKQAARGELKTKARANRPTPKTAALRPARLTISRKKSRAYLTRRRSCQCS